MCLLSRQRRRGGEGAERDRGVTEGVMEGNSCGVGRFIQSLGQRAGSRSDMMVCQGNSTHLHSSSEARRPQWPPFMVTVGKGKGRGGTHKVSTVKKTKQRRGGKMKGEDAEKRPPCIFVLLSTCKKAERHGSRDGNDHRSHKSE